MTLTILVGLPGSGKSTLVKDGTFGIVICPDDYRKVLTGHDFYKPAEEFIWLICKTVARVHLMRGESIVVDACHVSRRSRAMWVKLAQEYGAKVNCIWVNTPLDECIRRADLRERKVPIAVIEAMHRNFEEPTEDEGFTVE